MGRSLSDDSVPIGAMVSSDANKETRPLPLVGVLVESTGQVDGLRAPAVW